MFTVDAKNIHTITFSNGWQLFSGANSLTLSSACSKWGYWKFSNLSFSNFSILWIQIPVKSSGRTYRRSYFYLNNILKLKKESSAKTFITTRATRHLGPQGLTYCIWILDCLGTVNLKLFLQVPSPTGEMDDLLYFLWINSDLFLAQLLCWKIMI